MRRNKIHHFLSDRQCSQTYSVQADCDMLESVTSNQLQSTYVSHEHSVSAMDKLSNNIG